MNDDTAPVALVTGAAKRIGAAIVRRLHEQGFQVIIHYGTSREEAFALASELNRVRPQSATAIQANLNDEQSLKQLCTTLNQNFQRCDLLINNASSFFPTPIGGITSEHWEEIFSSNAKAPLFLAQYLLPVFSYGANIINITDIHAERPLKNHTVYCMAKAANSMLTQSLARDLAPKIRVNGIAPGAILWPENIAGDPQTLLEHIPLATLGGETAIVETVMFLLKNDYVTGEIITVDGGRTLHQ